MFGTESDRVAVDCANPTSADTERTSPPTLNDRVLPEQPPVAVPATGNGEPNLDEMIHRLGHESILPIWPNVRGYEILDELGRGSMGVVYKARQIEVQRIVALKMIRADVNASQEELHRFLAEARVLASLQHPNIVQLFEVNHRKNSPYFCMELVTGGTLADRLNGRPQAFRPAAQLLMSLARSSPTVTSCA